MKENQIENRKKQLDKREKGTKKNIEITVGHGIPIKWIKSCTNLKGGGGNLWEQEQTKKGKSKKTNTKKERTR